MVKSSDAVLSTGTCMPESLPVESLGGELWRVVNVGVIFANKVVGELSGVGCIAIDDWVPSALRYVVDFVRVARDGSACLVLRSRYVTFEGGERLDWFNVQGLPSGFWALPAVVKASLLELVSELCLPL